MDEAVFLPCWFFGLRSPCMEPLSYWGEPVCGVKMVASRTAHNNEYSPLSQLPVSLSHQWVTDSLHLLGDPSGSAVRSGPGSYEVPFFPLVPMSTRHCVFPPRLVFVSPNPAIKPCWPSKPNTLKALPSDIRAPDWRAWHGVQTSHSYGKTLAK